MIRCRCFRTCPGPAMSAPLHASLTPDQRQELRPRARLRVECLLLSAGGLKVPQLAAHLDCCEATVRTLLHRFAEEGLEAVHPQPPGFPSDLVHRQRIEEALDRLLAASADLDRDHPLGSAGRRGGLPPQAAHRTLLPEADGGPVAAHARQRTPQAGSGPGGRGGDDAGGTQKKSQNAELDLFFLDETGFSPSLPPHLHLGPGRRATGRPLREPRGPARERPGCPRRARHPPARAPDLVDGLPPWKGEHILDFLRNALPGRAGVPRIVVLDNASCHRSRTVRQAPAHLHGHQDADGSRGDRLWAG